MPYMHAWRIVRVGSLTTTKDHEGSRAMVDLLDIVKKYYYNPRTKGSNSLKAVQILQRNFLRKYF